MVDEADCKVRSAIIDSLQRTFTSADVATVFVFCQGETGKDKSERKMALARAKADAKYNEET